MTTTLLQAPPDYPGWDKVARLLSKSFAYMTPILGHPARAISLDAQALAKAAHDGAAFLILHHDHPVACLFTRPSRDYPASLYCGWLAVAHSERGHGLTNRLFHAAETEALIQRRTALTLDTGRPLSDLHRLFHHLGFSDIPGNDPVVQFLKPLPCRLPPSDPRLPETFNLLHRAFAGMKDRIDPPSSLEKMTLNSLRLDAEIKELWVLPQKDIPIACMILTPKSDRLHLGKLATDPAHQRSGLARRLMSCAEIRAKTLGLSSITLQTRIELTDNHAAFRALGFHQTDATAHPGYTRPTSLTFTKQL